jgi:NAD(P)-dependent dehydrogenase (short-subunit alcohol dehydrogenase family)
LARRSETLHHRRVRVIVTGGNSGVGKATAEALAATGHSVMIALWELSVELTGCDWLNNDAV